MDVHDIVICALFAKLAGRTIIDGAVSYVALPSIGVQILVGEWTDNNGYPHVHQIAVPEQDVYAYAESNEWRTVPDTPEGLQP